MAGRAPPPIAICNFDFRGSGTVAKSIEIAIALRQRGLPAELWCVVPKGPLRARVPVDVPVRGLIGGGFLPRREMMKASIPLLAIAIRRRKPALILSGGNHMHNGLRRALKLSGRRALTRFGVRASNSSARPGAPPPDADRLKKYRSADFAVAVTPELIDDIKASGSKAEIHVIPNGVDLDRIDRMIAEAGALDSLPGQHIVTMGRITHQKGFDILVDAMALLHRKDAKLSIIGGGSAEEVAALRKRIDARGLSDRIALTGFMANPFGLMASADLFVSSSRWEGASNVLLEALACRLPIVATDCPTGNAEIVGHGENGALVPVEDAPALARAIDDALDRTADRERQRARAETFALPTCLESWSLLLAEEYRRGLALRFGED